MIKIDGQGFTTEDYKTVGYNTPWFNQRFDLNTLENSEYKINENRFLEYIVKLFGVNSQVVQIKRVVSKSEIMLTILTSGNVPVLQLVYKNSDHRLDIVSMMDKEKKISLRTTYNEQNNPKENDNEQIIFNHLFDLLVDYWIDLPALYSKEVSRILSQPINENDIKLLKNDSNFLKMVNESRSNADNQSYLENYYKLVK